MNNYQDQYALYRGKIEAELERILPAGDAEVISTAPKVGEMPALLRLSMRYSLTSGGKRLRPVLALAAADLLGGPVEEALPYACAVELIHTYSLIHDDLPALDNDELRRGRPTNHMVFGEGIAILAGDGLQALAHEHMLEKMPEGDRLSAHWKAMREVAAGSGVTGIVGGQTLDVAWEGREQQEAVLQAIHMGKTAALFIAPLRAGAWIGGADEDGIAAITEYGKHLGMAFQITDDILDVTGESGTLGKTVGSDAREKKLTFVSLYGIDASREMAAREVRLAVSALEPFGERAWFLTQFVRSVLERNF